VSAAAFTKIPTGLAIRLLPVLSRLPSLSDRVDHILSLQGTFEIHSFETAISEGCKKQLDGHSCHQLYKIARLLAIPLNDRALDAISKHLVSTPEVFKAFAEDVCEALPQSYRPRTVEILFEGCALLKDVDLAAFVYEQSEQAVVAPSAKVVAGLAKVYFACELFDKVCDMYEGIIQPAKLQIDGAFGEILVKSATLTGRTGLADTLLESCVGDLAKHAKQISNFGKDGDLKGAIAVFEKLQNSGQILPTVVYNCLLDACVQCGDLKLTMEYFADMKVKGLVDVVSFNTMMKGHLMFGDMKAAESLIVEMVEAGLTANRITYHALLNARVQNGDRAGAWVLLEQMQNAGVAPNAVTFSILLKSLSSRSGAGDLLKIMNLIDKLEKGFDEVLFASVVEACIRTNRLDLLSEKTKMYGKRGGLLKMTAPTYGSMIKAYGQAQDVNQVWELWNDMVDRQVKPTPITLGCMVEALVTNHCTEDAWRLVQKAWLDETLRGSVNTVIYSTILKGFSLSKQPDKVVELYDEMRAKGIHCNTITYNTLLNAFARCGSMHRVPAVLNDMKNATPSVEPDIVTFSTIVKGYCMSGDVDKAFQLLKEMEDDGKYAPDEVMFNSLLDGCAKQHRLESALKLLEDMRSAGVAPSNYTLSILVKLLGRSRRLNQAFSMVEKITKEHGFRPNVQVYTCLIQACFHNRQSGKALVLHDEMIAEGCSPDEKTYTAIVKGCLQAGAVEKAVAMVRCAYHVPDQSIPQSSGSVPGIDSRCLEEVVAKLGQDTPASRALLDDVQKCKNQSSAQQRRNFVSTNQRRIGKR
jgi:pentatricopeptide repeat protein